MPCSPPMMLVSMAGQASFQTARRSGPSTMERSYRPVADEEGMRGAVAELVDFVIFTTSFSKQYRARKQAVAGRINRLLTRAIAVPIFALRLGGHSDLSACMTSTRAARAAG